MFYESCLPQLMAWYHAFLAQNCFVPDIHCGIVCTSNGTDVYPDLDMRAQSLTAHALTPTSIHAVADGTAAVFFDLDSIDILYK